MPAQRRGGPRRRVPGELPPGAAGRDVAWILRCGYVPACSSVVEFRRREQQGIPFLLRCRSLERVPGALREQRLECCEVGAGGKRWNSPPACNTAFCGLEESRVRRGHG